MGIDSLPFVQAAGDGGPRAVTQVVVIHATDNTASDEAEAAYAAHRADQTSAHIYVDGDSAVLALPLGDIAYGCLPHGNRISVQFELSGLSSHLSDATMRQAAPLVAEVCRRYGIPPVKITAAQVRAGAKGICGHADITEAFPEDHGDHTDPGPAFPWATFIGYVTAGDDMSAQAESFLWTYSQGVPNFTDANGKTQVNVPVQDIIARQAWQKTTDAKLADLALKLEAVPAAVAKLETAVETLTDVARAIAGVLAKAGN